MQPDSPALVALLLLLAAGALYAVIRFHHLAIKISSGVLALLLSLLAGVASVNVYYGYYKTWGELTADLTNSYSSFTTPQDPARDREAAAGHGEIQQITLAGAHSGISRTAYVYLPPQYFEHQFAQTRFPVVELLHGTPGGPVNWVLQINIESIMDQLIAKRLVGPMIVVMPSFNSSHGFQECLDTPGALDDTYISQDVPDDIKARYRATLIPAEWGIGGYSSGGYCAANLALRHRGDYGAAGVMDGYFRPADGPAATTLHGNATLEAQNDPLATAQRLNPGADPLPAFWISAGTAAAKYNKGAHAFVAALNGIQAVTFTTEPGAGHNFYAWRPAIPRMLAWMWGQLAAPDLRVHFPVVGPVNNSILIVPKAPPRTKSHHPHSTSTPSATH